MTSLSQQIEAAREGNTEAFGAIVEQFRGMAFGCAYAVLRDRGLAEDAVQEAFLEAFQKLMSLREPEAFGGWLRRIVLTRCNRMTRRVRDSAVAKGAHAAADPDGPEVPAEAMADNSEALDALHALPEGQRLAAMLFYLAGCSHAKVAAWLEVPVSTVKKRLHDARARLRKEMLDRAGDEVRRVAGESATAERVGFLLAFGQELERGKPAVKALAELAGEARGVGLRRAIGHAIAGAGQGLGVAAGLSEGPGLFPPMVLSLIAEGERLGRLDETCRMAGEWLRTGSFAAPPGLYQGMVSPMEGIVRDARATGARRVILAPGDGSAGSGGGDSLDWQITLVFPEGREEQLGRPVLARQIPGIEEDLKRHTTLDPQQDGESLAGTLDIPASRVGGEFTCRVRYEPTAQGVVVAIAF